MTFYLDSSVFIALITSGHVNHDAAVAFANTALYRKERLYISTHTLEEALLTLSEFRQRHSVAARYICVIKRWPKRLEDDAYVLERKHGLRYEDSLHVLIAKQNGIFTIVSFDKDMKKAVKHLRLQYFNPKFYKIT